MIALDNADIEAVHGGAALGKAIGAVAGAIIGGALVLAAEVPTGGAATAGAIGVVGTCSKIGAEIGAVL